MNKNDFSHFKAGTQYSHYLGAYLQDALSSVKLSKKIIEKSGEKAEHEALEWLENAKENISQITQAIHELDKLNKLEH